MEQLKSIKEMTPEEMKTYFADVQKWDENSYPRLLAHVDAWTEAEVKEFGTGLYLVTALAQARSFVAKADQFTHEKALSMIKRHLDYARRYDKTPKDDIDPRSGIVRHRHDHAAVVPVSKENAETGEVTQTDPEKRYQQITAEVAKRFGGRRPNHYDEWKHLMSDELRAKVDELPAYYLELAAASEMSDKLDDDPRATQADRASANQRVLDWDDKIQAVHNAAEEEWTKISAPAAPAGPESPKSPESPAEPAAPVKPAKPRRTRKAAK